MPKEVTKVSNPQSLLFVFKSDRIEPDYQELSNSNIPKAEESMGSQAPVYTIPPTTFFGFAIDPGAQFYQDQELQKSRLAFAHVLESGKGGCFGSSKAPPVLAHIVVFGPGIRWS
ncbi:hypothetical protein Bca52824_087410 [Brassica carinata]|uniref:Uncharacterized protein n=1 Tax=Brassica carinata TaxID=52824 RepID=A0A8X7PBY1_BRACI|nr:hypothetical protein Bca52824_087410 [Brassica carinata]